MLKKVIFNLKKRLNLWTWKYTDKDRYKFYLCYSVLYFYGKDLAYSAALNMQNPGRHRLNNRVPVAEIESIDKKGNVRLKAKSLYDLHDLTK